MRESNDGLVDGNEECRLLCRRHDTLHLFGAEISITVLNADGGTYDGRNLPHVFVEQAKLPLDRQTFRQLWPRRAGFAVKRGRHLDGCVRRLPEGVFQVVDIDSEVFGGLDDELRSDGEREEEEGQGEEIEAAVEAGHDGSYGTEAQSGE